MSNSAHATKAGTARYQSRFPQLAESHFTESQGPWLSSLGLGSYLGDADERTDAAYVVAVRRALELGCNVFDTAANYRFQRSERSIGAALATSFADGTAQRDEVFVTTKGGYLPFDGHAPRSRQEMTAYLEETFIRPGICRPEDFLQGSHCMTPRYLEHQLNQSLSNLRLDSIDGYYIHNPEAQFAAVDREEFYRRLRAAFEFLEAAVAVGKIGRYGTATWNGYRVGASSRDFLSLERVVATAREVAGDAHHCRIVQLPINLAMTEAFTHANQTVNGKKATLLEAATELGVMVMASASMMQAQLAAGLPPLIAQTFPGLATDAQRALQFTRSTPGVAVALVGMSRTAHVEENLALAATPRAAESDYLRLFAGSPQ